MSVLSRIVSTIVTPLRILTSWVTRMIPGFRRLAQISLPARFAWMTFVFLLIVLGAGVIKYMTMPPDQMPNRHWTWWALPPILMMVVIPIVVYQLVKLVLQKPVSQAPDLDHAWQVGITALQRQQIQIRAVPLFVILGAEDAKQVRDLLDAVQIGTSVTPPEGENLPLLWYANSSAVFLFVNGCSSLSKLSAKRGATAPAAEASIGYSPASAGTSRTIDASAGSAVGLSAVSSPGPQAPLSLRPQRPTAQPAAPASTAARGTLDFNPRSPLAERAITVETAAPPQSQARLNSDELASQTWRLNYVCDLLRVARRPVCALNGVLVMTPFELVESASPQAQIAVQNDLEILRDRLAVRCPTTLVLSEMERIDGFLELVKRVGDDNSREGRFGKGCSVWGDPQTERLDSVAAHAVGAFEDWIYRLFQNSDALRRRYNGKLVSLLCRTRGPFAEALRAYVRNGFGYDPKTHPELSRSQFLFAGCYFAATGEDADRQAFIKSVFAKLIENQGELEWAPKARDEDHTCQTWANIISLIGMLAVIAIVAGLAWRW